MQLKKIKEEHYIVVTDDTIKVGDYFIDNRDNRIETIENESLLDAFYDCSLYDWCKKITHSTQPLEMVNDGVRRQMIFGYDKVKPIDLSYVKSLFGEVDVEKMAEEKCVERFNNTDSYHKRKIFKLGIGIGYNQCLDDNKDKRYTEEDVKIACRLFARGNTLDSCIKSIQPKDTWEVYFDSDNNLKLNK